MQSHLTKEIPRAFPHFFRRKVFFVRRQGPLVAEWVSELPASIAPEHIGHRHIRFRPSRHSAGEGMVCIFNIEIETNGCASKALRPAASHIGMFLTQKDDRIPDLDFRVHDAFLIGSKKAHPLLRTEPAFVKPDGLLNTPHGERRSDGMKADRNWVY